MSSPLLDVFGDEIPCSNPSPRVNCSDSYTDLKNRTGSSNTGVGVREKMKPTKFNLYHTGLTTFLVTLL